MQQFEFQYGSDEQGLKLTGVADFKFGKHPRFDGVLSGRQIDLDRALAADNGTRPPPAAAIRRIAQLAAGAFRPAIPIQIGVGIDRSRSAATASPTCAATSAPTPTAGISTASNFARPASPK